MAKKYITRLTPNDNNWIKPSGRAGKCKSADPLKLLYEERFGYGWEEWIFENYFAGDEICLGFVQALNRANKTIKKIDELHFYTRICENGKKTHCYIGFIKNVEIIDVRSRAITSLEIKKREEQLKDVGLILDTNMIANAINIRFKKDDLKLISKDLKSNWATIRLKRGQFRFGLYDLDVHVNLTQQINSIITMNT